MKGMTIENDSSRGDVILTGADLPPDVMEALDRAFVADGGKRSRSDLVAGIVADWLRGKGYMRSRGCDEGTRPENLTSENDM